MKTAKELYEELWYQNQILLLKRQAAGLRSFAGPPAPAIGLLMRDEALRRYRETCPDVANVKRKAPSKKVKPVRRKK